MHKKDILSPRIYCLGDIMTQPSEKYISALFQADSHKFYEKINDVYNIFKKICPEEIKDIFITNPLDESEEVQYEDIFFFQIVI